MGKKFNTTAEEAEKKYKSIRSSYGRWLRKVKKIPSDSGRDAVPFAGDYANLGWLEQHRGHRTRSSILNRADSDDLNESQSPETEDKEDEQDAGLCRGPGGRHKIHHRRRRPRKKISEEDRKEKGDPCSDPEDKAARDSKQQVNFPQR